MPIKNNSSNNSNNTQYQHAEHSKDNGVLNMKEDNRSDFFMTALDLVASTIDIIFTSIMDIIINLFNKHGRLELNQLAEQYANATDKIILDVKRSEGLKYYGGKLIFSIVIGNNKEENVKVAFEGFFKNHQDTWIKKSTHNLIPVRYVSEKSLSDISSAREIAFEVTEPH